MICANIGCGYPVFETRVGAAANETEPVLLL